MSHLTSRKRKCPYFEGRTKCKITTCHVIIELSISKKSIVKGAPTVNVRTSGQLVHKNGEKVYSRPLSDEKRLQVAETITKVGVDKYYYQQFQNANADSIKSGNLTDVYPVEVLRKAHSEHKNSIISTDPLTDIY